LDVFEEGMRGIEELGTGSPQEVSYLRGDEGGEETHRLTLTKK